MFRRPFLPIGPVGVTGKVESMLDLSPTHCKDGQRRFESSKVREGGSSSDSVSRTLTLGKDKGKYQLGDSVTLTGSVL